MAGQLDRDTWVIAMIFILVVQVIVIGGSLMYFRKKENDALNQIFQLQDRIDQLEVQIRHRPVANPNPPAE